MKRKIFTFVFVFLLLQIFAQKTGNFYKTIDFNSQQRTLACYVPTTYTNTNSYRLVIGLHGCGSAAAGFRNELKFLADSINAIVVCPVGLTGNSGYMGPPDQGVVGVAIDSVLNNYNIDTNEVFLVGFSCNGFATLLDGMFKTNFNYKGIITWHAAIIPQDFTSGAFNYTTTTKACICTGTADFGYPENLRLRDSLSANGADYMFISIPGLGHTTSFPTFKEENMKCFRHMTNVITPPPATVNTTSIKNTEDSSPVEKIFPNPAGSSVFIQLAPSSPCSLEVIDSRGRLVLTTVIRDAITEVSFTHIPAGLYVIKITSTSGTSSVNKLLKE